MNKPYVPIYEMLALTIDVVDLINYQNTDLLACL